MTKEEVIAMAGWPRTYYPKMAHVLGIKEAILVCLLLRSPGDRTAVSQAEITEKTAMSRYEQETARKNLRDLGILKEERSGIPARLYYSLDLEQLARAIVSEEKG